MTSRSKINKRKRRKEDEGMRNRQREVDRELKHTVKVGEGKNGGGRGIRKYGRREKK